MQNNYFYYSVVQCLLEGSASTACNSHQNALLVRSKNKQKTRKANTRQENINFQHNRGHNILRNINKYYVTIACP